MLNFPVLVADIGGTHARFAWAETLDQPPSFALSLKVAEFDSPLSAVQYYLAHLRHVLGASAKAPRQACFAVAATVLGDTVTFTNSPWSFSCSAMQSSLNLDRFLACNDFEALAYALPHLADRQVRTWDQALLRTVGNLAVLGPGTGLGVAGLVKTQSGWLAVSGEGGHASLAPADDFESEILAHVRKTHGHVSAERLLSGIGLPLLHQTVQQIKGLPDTLMSTELLVSRGLGTDASARETLSIFCAWLGVVAGGLALTFGARGGVYVGGGIVPRLGDFFFASAFRERFIAKGRFSSYLAKIPLAVIQDSDAALLGALHALMSEA
jgi:glucokinase